MQRASCWKSLILRGRTTFIPAIGSFSIRQALQSAAYSDDLIAHLKPEVNGKAVDIDSCICDLNAPAIRLRAFPLKGGGGKVKGKSKDDQERSLGCISTSHIVKCMSFQCHGGSCKMGSTGVAQRSSLAS